MSGIKIPCFLRLTSLDVKAYNRLPQTTYSLELQKRQRYLAFIETKQSLLDFICDRSQVMKKDQLS